MAGRFGVVPVRQRTFASSSARRQIPKMPYDTAIKSAFSPMEWAAPMATILYIDDEPKLV
jgi:hypothetical protein